MAKHTAERLPRVAYLTGAYPAVSHTFILREVEGLRDLGLEVLPCSIRRTPPGTASRPGRGGGGGAHTFHVLEAAKRPATLLAAQAPRCAGRGAISARLGWR
jgi:hypothetical protein